MIESRKLYSAKSIARFRLRLNGCVVPKKGGRSPVSDEARPKVLITTEAAGPPEWTSRHPGLRFRYRPLVIGTLASSVASVLNIVRTVVPRS